MANKKSKKVRKIQPTKIDISEYRKAKQPKAAEKVNHPAHYQNGKDGTYETIKVIEAWGLDKDFLLGNTVKYISRAGKKVDGIGLDEEVRKAELEDLKKAAWYLQRKIANIEKSKK